MIKTDTVTAAKQYRALKTSAGTYNFLASVNRMLELLADTMGWADDAAAHFADSLAFCRRPNYRPELA